MRLYALGSNGSGQLALGHQRDVSVPEKCHLPADIINNGIKQVVAGGNHALVLSRTGFVQAFGGTNLSLENVSMISATWTASVCLKQAGRVATMGDGLNGELGLGMGISKAKEFCDIPDFPPQGASVVHVASSMSHTVAVLDNGEVWGWGKGRHGQLGKPNQDAWLPRKVQDVPFPVAKAVCGKDFTCIIGEPAQGNLLILGIQGRDRFGLKSQIATQVPGWTDIAASWGSIYVLINGRLIGFGRNDHGQLPPPGLTPIVQIAAGSEHCLALTKCGKILAWGWGEHGNCGQPIDSNGDVKSRWNEIDLVSPTAIFAGCATSFIATC
ncbi:RCC1/BLIP-II [Piedraia hortae CBS 480.64]|uniref:RCC1/BLIP-II n=1 Tax=Piedraia hortae CBS 480.64 TaxID=1314780 RepID=A0A6A7BZX3_9PEZI|nr:RCC1/BLIP-II [Piedraia hortae CBS 480.64]